MVFLFPERTSIDKRVLDQSRTPLS